MSSPTCSLASQNGSDSPPYPPSPDPQTHATYLFNIPLEVLMMIIEHVVLDSRPPPALDDERRRSSTSVYQESNKTQVHVQPGPVANSAALLSCCRDLATLTRAVIERLDALNRCVFKLDVLLIGERQFWTTWLCLPFVPGPKHIGQLDISIRIADGHQVLLCPNNPGCQFASAVQSYYSTRLLDRTFLYLIGAVLCRSAMLDLQDGERRLAAQGLGPRDHHTLVNRIHIDISACKDAVVAEKHQREDWLAARPNLQFSPVSPIPADLLSFTMRPEWLAEMINEALSNAIVGEEPDRQLVLSRVGDISILVDGDVHSELDLGQRFADMKPQAPTLDAAWWDRVLALRAELGFSVGSADPFIRTEPSLSRQGPPPKRRASSRFASRVLRILNNRSNCMSDPYEPDYVRSG